MNVVKLLRTAVEPSTPVSWIRRHPIGAFLAWFFPVGWAMPGGSDTKSAGPEHQLSDAAGRRYAWHSVY